MSSWYETIKKRFLSHVLTLAQSQDAAKMVNHMRYCTNMEKGAPYMAETALNCKKEVRH